MSESRTCGVAIGQRGGECRVVVQPPRAMGAARRAGGEIPAHTLQFSKPHRTPFPRRFQGFQTADRGLRLVHSLMGRPPGTKSMALPGNRPLPAALQHRHHRLSDKSIQHRRDARLAQPFVRLLDLHALSRPRPSGPARQLFPDGRPMLLQAVCPIADGHPVHARTPLVGFESLQRPACRLPLMRRAADSPLAFTPCRDRSRLQRPLPTPAARPG